MCGDIGTPSAGCQNVVRDTADADPIVRPQGTFTIRRRFTNLTGRPVTSLRFRVVDLTTIFAPGYENANQSDLRALTSADTTVTTTNGASVLVVGTTLEQPPSQESGGGYNSTFSVGRVSLAEPLAPGASVDVQFRLGVARAGTFRFFVNVEAATNDLAAPESRTRTKTKADNAKRRY